MTNSMNLKLYISKSRYRFHLSQKGHIGMGTRTELFLGKEKAQARVGYLSLPTIGLQDMTDCIVGLHLAELPSSHPQYGLYYHVLPTRAYASN